MRIKCLAQRNNILLPGFEPSTSVSKTDILTNRPICSISLYTETPDIYSVISLYTETPDRYSGISLYTETPDRRLDNNYLKEILIDK